MIPPRRAALSLIGSAFLCGCAATAQPASSAPRTAPECSFRSATTCWTLAARFPSPRVAKPDSARKGLLEPPAVILASRPDSLPLR
jgi:hypothetical protein